MKSELDRLRAKTEQLIEEKNTLWYALNALANEAQAFWCRANQRDHGVVNMEGLRIKIKEATAVLTGRHTVETW